MMLVFRKSILFNSASVFHCNLTMAGYLFRRTTTVKPGCERVTDS